MPEIQERWRAAVHSYAKLVNAYVARGERDGWDDAGPEPRFRGPDGGAEAALDAVRAANRHGTTEGLRDEWPPAHAPFADTLDERGQGIPTVAILDDGSIVARIGAPWEPDGYVVRIHGDSVTRIPGITHFGRSPDRRFFAVATPDGVTVTDGWAGDTVSILPWPTGQEGVPARFSVAPLEAPPIPTTLVPFDNGERALLACPAGVFVLTTASAHRLVPTPEAIDEHFTWLTGKYPEDDLACRVSMEHGAVSADGSLIAVGAQDGRHLVYDAGLNLIAQVGPHGEYPHFAAFTADQKSVVFNACHFYNGGTIAVPTADLHGFDTEHYAEDERMTTFDSDARVYAAAARGADTAARGADATPHGDEIILGDAYGYLSAFGPDGKQRWRHFVGSTISGLDLTPDGRTLVVGSYAGWLSIVTLDAEPAGTAGTRQPYQIGTGNHHEECRWLFWKGEETPLRW